MKKTLFASLGVVAAAALLVWIALGTETVQDRLFERAVAERAGLVRSDLLSADALHVFFCGTGSPMPDPDRAQACTAVLAGPHFILFDTGSGAAEVLARSRLPMGALSALFYTHLHSDHVSGLYDIILQSWVAGRHRPLTLYGPPGVEALAEGFTQAFRLDHGYRTAHHGEEAMPSEGARLEAQRVVIAEGNESALLFDRDGLKITVFRVDHHPIDPAYGYRVDYKDRAVVLSGDTVKHPNLVRFGEGADVMVHEALAPHMVSALADQVETRQPRIGGILRDTLDYHASPVEAAETANEAGASLLVYSHIVPPLPNRIAETMFLRGVDDVRPEGVVLGYDGLLVSLPAGNDTIEQTDLR